MRGITAAAGYVPHHRLRRDRITEALGGRAGRGTRAVASYDEDATTMAVAAARLALSHAEGTVDQLWFTTTSPTYVDRTNATAIHAALRLERSALALDFGGASRSAIGAFLAANAGSGTILVVASDVRTGLPGGPDEVDGGDAAVALVLGDDGSSSPVIAQVLGTGSATEEFLDRWRTPGDRASRLWEERFAETRYIPLAMEAFDSALATAQIAEDAIDTLIVTGLHGRAVAKAVKQLAARLPATAVVADTRGDTVGNPGAAQALLALTDALERSPAGRTIVLVSLADGADAVVLRTTPAIADWRPARTVASQVASGDDRLPYATFLTWRGMLDREPPRRPEPARTSSAAAARTNAYKYGFVGSRDTATGAIHLPPARVSYDGGAVDDMEAAPMADTPATIATFTVDHLAYSPSPPTVFAVLDFDGGGRTACAMTDVDADAVAIGDRVEMTFRRLGTSDGIANYFWKARPVPDVHVGDADAAGSGT